MVFWCGLCVFAWLVTRECDSVRFEEDAEAEGQDVCFVFGVGCVYVTSVYYITCYVSVLKYLLCCLINECVSVCVCIYIYICI